MEAPGGETPEKAPEAPIIPYAAERAAIAEEYAAGLIEDPLGGLRIPQKEPVFVSSDVDGYEYTADKTIRKKEDADTQGVYTYEINNGSEWIQFDPSWEQAPAAPAPAASAPATAPTAPAASSPPSGSYIGAKRHKRGSSYSPQPRFYGGGKGHR